MDRTTSHGLLLDISRRRITRQQTKKLKRTFPFFELPAEMRNLIYNFCLDDCIDLKPFFDRYYLILQAAKARRASAAEKKARMPFPQKKMHNNVLLLNKQIFAEAYHLIKNKQTILFDHGLFGVYHVSQMVNAEALRRVTSLEISDAGHPIIRGRILPDSWHGYMRLFKQLAELFAEGHNLKTFTIDLKDTRMLEHMTTCWHATYNCGFREQIVEATDELCKIRGVGCVTIHGLNPDHALKLKTRMESVPKKFMDLPREVRDMIYNRTVDWNHVNGAIVHALAGLTRKNANKKYKMSPQQFRYPSWQVSSVLLVNKQISAEVSQVLHKNPLTLTFPAGHNIHVPDGMPYMLNGFISQGALLNVKFLTLELGAWEWIYSCLGKDFIRVLAASKNLEQLTIVFKDTHKKEILFEAQTTYPDRQIHDTFSNLIMLRGLKAVYFMGDLPDCYIATFKQYMTSIPVAGEPQPRFYVEMGDGCILDIADAA